MSTKEQLYTMIDSMTEQQMQELIRFLDGHNKKCGNASGDVKGILSAYADPSLVPQEEGAWERNVHENN